MRYYIIAGEASGDLHGSNLVRGLAAEDKEARIRFWGGDMMKAAAGESGVPAELVRHYRDGAVMGFTEVLAKGFKLLRNVEFCREDIAAWKPDVVILIDYPGFNMKIASFCHRHGIKVFYYIAPKTWASREGRNRRLKAWVDRLFIVFPFEKEYFSSRGIGYVYEGNPLVDAVDSHDFVRPVPGRYIALLAGSRKAEIARTMPICMELADKLSALPRYEGYKFVVAGAPARTREDYQQYIGSRTNVELLFGRTYDILKFADALFRGEERAQGRGPHQVHLIGQSLHRQAGLPGADSGRLQPGRGAGGSQEAQRRRGLPFAYAGRLCGHTGSSRRRGSVAQGCGGHDKGAQEIAGSISAAIPGWPWTGSAHRKALWCGTALPY